MHHIQQTNKLVLLLIGLVLPILLANTVTAQICDRSDTIENLLLTTLNVTDCNSVTASDLNGISGTLNWQEQNITELSALDFDELDAVTEFDLSNNKLNAIIDDTMDGTKPSVVSFANNNISIIEPDALLTSGSTSSDIFYDLSGNNLTYSNLQNNFLNRLSVYGNNLSIDLSNNSINFLHRVHLDFSPNLLNLSYNQLGVNGALNVDSLDNIGFHNAQGEDKTIDLSHNEIFTFDTSQGGFFYKSTWGYIDLSHNKLVTLPTKLLESSRKIRHVDFGYNRLTSFNRNSIHPNNTNYEFILILDGNPLTLSANNFQSKKISDLYLRNANLTTLPANTFAGITNVDAIYLNNNNITTLVNNAFNGAVGLEVLYLNNNSITNIPSDAFGSISSLQNIYLQDNQIATIDTSAFSELGSLTTLDLSGNALSTLQSDDFLGMGATNIDVSNNNITALPINLLNQHNDPSTIISFNVAGNQLPSNSWEIADASWVEGAANSYTLAINHSLPQDMTIELLSTSGTLNSSNITIVKGDLISTAVQWTAKSASEQIHLLPANSTFAVTSLGGYINIPEQGTASLTSGKVCGRQQAIIDVLLIATGVAQCIDITIADLADVATDLNFSNVSLSTIVTPDFDYLYAVMHLDVSNNNITALTDNIFQLATPFSISLASNNIAQIATNALLTGTSPNNNLVYNLSNNAITSATLDSGFLNQLKSTSHPAKQFDLSHNNITTLAQSQLNVYAAQLNLSSNQIASFPTDAFANMMFAGNDLSLDLSNNLLTTLPASFIDTGTGLTSIYLNDNQITTVSNDALAQLTDLTTIDLSDNQISSLPINLLADHTDPSSITSFDVSGNLLVNDTWEITNVSWHQNSANGISLRLGHSLPQDISFNITSSNGNLSATEIIIAAGNTNSAVISWTAIDANQVVSITPSLNQINITALDGYITIPSYTATGVCGRNVAIRTALENSLNKACNLIMATDLESITGTVNWANLAIDQLTDIDLVDLINVDAFDLSSNTLTVLADNILLTANPSTISLASNNISVIQTNALVTSTSPDNNVDYNLSNNAITSTTLSSGFLTPLKSIDFPNKSIDLSYNNITTLDNSQLDIRSDNLNLSNNQITNLPATVFSNMRQAGHDMTIDLSYNQLTSIAAETILGETFAQVDLSYNQIDTLATDAVIYGEDLTLLDLGYNLISDFNASSIHQNPNDLNVQLDLVLDGNPLVLKANNFAGLELDYVYIQNSNLTTIPADTFAGATNINRIFLTGTNLTTLEAGAFSSVSGLDFLYLNNNQITTIPVNAFGTISSLTRIYLGDNNLTAVPENAFSNLTNIQTLTLNSNQLTAVPVNTLGNNASLTTFRLQDNNIANLSNVSFSEYTSLAELNLGANQITTLTADNFQGMTATKIYLSDNQISSLPINLLSGHSNPASITDFDFSSNPIGNNGWEITDASWVEGSSGEFTLQLGHALPSDVVLDLTSDTGTLSPSTITIASGSTSSSAVTWTEGAGVTVNINPVTAQINVTKFSGYINIPSYDSTAVCERTEAVRTAILDVLNISACEEVTYNDLAQFTADNFDLTNLGLTTLKDFDLDYLFGVAAFDLSTNALTTLGNSTFAQTNPSSISLASNNITDLQPNTFVGNNWTSINLAGNQIDSMQPNAFNGTEALSTLSLGYNNLVDFNATAVVQGDNPTQINNFNLDGNPLVLKANNFANMRIGTLYLRNTGITTVPTDAFSGTRQLDYIRFEGGVVTSLEANAFNNIPSFDVLFMREHPLETIPSDAFGSGTSLDKLFMERNQLSSIGTDAFIKLTTLVELWFTDNKFTVIPNNMGALTATRLILSGNQITAIAADSFDGIPNLNRVLLNDNQITSIAAGAFSSVPNLGVLSLLDNDLVELQSDAFANLSATDIDLRNNQLTALPVNLLINHTAPESITNFAISGNALVNDSWEITNVSWVEDSSGEFTLQLGHALPINITVPLSSTTGTLSPSTITIASGSTSSPAVTWTAGAGVNVDINPVTPQINVTQLSGYINIPSYESNGVCARTAAVITAILDVLNSSACEEVTYHDLIQLTAANFNLTNLGLTTVNDFDLDYLFGVAAFDLSNNALTALENNTFAHTNPSSISLANNNIDSIARTALFTNAVGDNNIDINLANNNISSATLANGFLNQLGDKRFTGGAFDLSNNQITTLNASMFTGFSPRSLALYANQITNFSADTFNAIVSSENIVVNLNNNNITDLQPNTFAGNKWTSISLAGNQIDSLQPNAFNGTEALSTLNLGDNNLVDFNATAVVQGENSTEIKTFILNGNPLVLKANNFANMSIDTLYLRNTGITTVPTDAFSGTRSLDYIRFEGGVVTSLEANAFNNIPSFDVLFMRDHLLETIPSDAFGSGTSLDKLFMERNQLSSIGTDAFIKLTTLVELYFTDNKFTVIPNNMGALKTTRLILSGNQITAIAADSFDGIPNLNRLLLNDNQITSIAAGAFSSVPNLGVLSLLDNDLVELQPDAFANLSATDIDLRNNQLTALPVNLLINHTAPQSITNFAISGNALVNDSWEITNVSWQDTAYNTYRLQLGHALPDDVTVNITSTSGNLSVSTLTITAGDTNSQAVEWTPGDDATLPIHISAVAPQQNITTLAGHINIPTVNFMGVCDRTAQIQTLILNALAISSCEDVTQSDLVGLSTNDIVFSEQTINTLSGIDLDYLTNLAVIDLSTNNLSTVVNSTFDATNPHSISLAHNNISVIEQNALLTSTSPDNNVDYNLSNNAITSTTLSSGFLNVLRDPSHPFKVIDLSYNNITTLERTSLAVFTTNLNLSHNQIGDFAFDALYDLRVISIDMVLDLSYNQLTNIAARSFVGESVGQVDLSHNQIDTLAPEAVFSGVDLSSLDLGYNLISDFNASSINQTNNPKVQLDLVLDGNPLVLKANSFAGLDLDDVYLRNANITTIPSGTFSGTSNVNVVYLNNNQISTVTNDSFTGATGLDVLYLGNNSLSSMPNNLFAPLTELQKLDLSDNDLTGLSTSTFAGLNAIDINLSSNNITALPMNLLLSHADPAAITSFDISNNQLPNDTWEITNVSWVEEAGDSYYLEIGHTLPVDVVLPLSSSNGDLNVTQVTITKGATTSNKVSWTTSDTLITEAHISTTLTTYQVPQLSGYLAMAEIGTTAGICQRTIQIMDLLLDAVTQSNCADVFPSDLTAVTGNLAWQDQNISTLSGIDLDYLTNIAVIDLSANNLSTVVNSTFDLTNPDSISLAHNNISVIEQGALLTSTSPDNYVDYNLSNNAITSTTLSSGFLNVLSAPSFPFKTIDLSYNNITTLERTSFAVFTTNMNLSHNQIGDFAFDALYDLRLGATDMVLDLSYNQLSNIAALSIAGESMGQVDLSYNQIDTLATNAVYSGVDLTRLDLGYNLISDFNASSIDQNPSNLNVQLDLVLDGNPLVLKANSFVGLDLDNVYLRNANITTIPSGTFSGTTNVNVVYLNNNQINTVTNDSFTGATGLDVLYLGNNSLSSIPNNLFASLTELQKLDLSDNDLTGLSTSTFAGLNVTDINLSSNNITALPMNLLLSHADPAAITSFDISNHQLPNNSWEITNVSWVEGVNDEFTLQLGHALPINITVPLSSSNGDLNVTQVTITKGATTSSKVSWTTSDTLITEAHIRPTLTTYEVPQLSGYLTMAEIGTPAGICQRTIQIIDLLLDAVTQSNCADVFPSDLTAVTGNLAWQDKNISTITSSDLVYLANIDSFDLANNNLSTLVDYMFSSAAPTTVSLANNNISVIGAEALFTSVLGDDDVNFNLSSNALTTATLATGFLSASGNKKFVGGSFDLSFNQITTLEAASLADFNPAQLYLNDNALTSIEDNALAAATDLQILNLANNQLSTITAATFNGLAATAIDLSNNNITSLPIDLLINHTDPAAITTFDLAGNGITTWEITTAGWSKLPGDNTQLVIPHPLPMDVTVTLSSTTGTLNPSTVTILAGELNSSTVTWTGDAGNALEVIPAQTQVNIPLLNGFVRIEGIADAASFVGSVDPQTVVQDHMFTPIQLPIATGGDGALSYSLTETNGTNLPASLVFDPNNRMLSGSVDTAGNYSLTYIAADIDNDQTNIVFTLEVLPNFVPTFPSQANLTFTVLQDELLNVSLPASSAGNGEIVYSLDPLGDLPAGLMFNATERSITGSTNAMGTYDFTYSATDSSDDESASLNISIVINEQISPEFNTDELFDNKTMRSDATEFKLALPAAFGGNGELSYSFTTDGTAGLPAGLIFNATSRMIEGQPTEFGTFNITVTLDDSDLTDVDDSASFSFTLILLESLAFVANVEPSYNTVAFTPVSIPLPAAQGGVLSYTYSLNGTLPAGLSFNASSRIIMGEATESGDYNLTYRVTDNDGYIVEQQTVLIVQVLTTEFLSSINDIEIQLGQSISMTLPAVTTDGQVDIIYSISGAPAGISFNGATRQLTGGATELGTHTITYKATDTTQQQVEQSFDVIVTANTDLLQDIMWRKALAIADQTVNSVKKRFALVNQHRLPYVENANGIGANFQVTETNWLGLWLNSGSGSLANQDNAYSWDGSTGVTQIGVDFSGKDYLVGLTSESVSTSSSFTVTGDAYDYTGNLDISGLGLLSFYGGYYQPKYSVWAISSSGSGSADLSVNVENSTSSLSTGVDYSMSAFGGSYKLAGIFDVGFEGITSAALDFSDNTISSVSSNSASRNKFFGSIDFGKWINKSASQSPAKSLSWSPKLALALRSDSGEGSSSSGLETTVSVQLAYNKLNLEIGSRNFASGDFSESGQWLSFNLIPTGKAGLNFTHRQQFGNSGSAENALLSDAALTDIVSGMRQSDTVTSISTIAYGWNIKAGSLQLYSKGESSYADSTAINIFDTKSDIQWEHIGLSFDSASSKYSWNADITGGFMDQYINNVDDTEQTTAISFKAKIKF